MFPENKARVSGGKKCLSFGKFELLCFLETPVLRFALLPYYRRLEMSVLEPIVSDFEKLGLEPNYNTGSLHMLFKVLKMFFFFFLELP